MLQWKNNVVEIKSGKMEKKYKYQVKITLLDNTVITIEKEYNWGNYADELNKTNNPFININGIVINKSSIKTIITTESEKEEKDEECYEDEIFERLSEE